MDTNAPKSSKVYDIQGRIASGGMAVVYQAIAKSEEGFAKKVALKQIHPKWSGRSEIRQQFVKEARVASNLDHANIVSVVDFGSIGSSLFLAMEYVHGTDVAGLLDGEASIPLSSALGILQAVFRGLAHAHVRGVIHRDISPGNILLSTSAEIKVADFGIAIEQHDNQGRLRAGKFCYMSPEQIAGEDLTVQTDIFSAGLLGWELLHGKALLGEVGGDELREKLRAFSPEEIEFSEAVPDTVKQLLKECLEPSPEKRPDASEIVDWIGRIMLEEKLVFSERELAELVSARVQPVATVDLGPELQKQLLGAELPRTLPIKGVTVLELEHGPTPGVKLVAAKGERDKTTRRKWWGLALLAVAIGAFGVFFFSGPNTTKNNSTFSLRVTSVPMGATLLLGGQPQGETPINLEIEKFPALVELQLAGYEKATRQVENNAESELLVELEPSPRQYEIVTVPPGAAVEIGGAHQGVTPLLYESHNDREKVRLALAGYESAEGELRGERGQQTRVQFILQELPAGYLKVALTSAGGGDAFGDLFVDGKLVGKAPTLKRISLSPGRHEIRVRHRQSKKSIKKQVVIHSKKTKTILLQMPE